ncbi:DUF2752 domain-containing protein [Cellulosilyticum ruminicola]|uniref:DUF2752 domain-containing protein n=1 Tax=Cellulosilyticum ruminicola TaxID=425254 RepID=UPI0006D06785|nr:DUF2752 domain-containing protein [Cellulosilyticum ruminicola]
MERMMKRLRILGMMILCALVYIVIQSLWPIGCPIKYLWHIPCPGCGMTRAWRSVMHGDLKTAFYFHPLFFTVPFMAGMLIWEDLFTIRLKKRFWGVILVLYLATYGMRLINCF